MFRFMRRVKRRSSPFLTETQVKLRLGTVVGLDTDFFFNFGFFKNLIYIFGPPFGNFTEMDPCRPVAGRQGVFCKICTARNIKILRRGPPEGLSPGHWATGPLLPHHWATGGRSPN